MTANRTQVGVLAMGLLVVLIAIGCSSDSDVISSGNVVVDYPANTINPSSINYSCIRMNYKLYTVKPADGVCSESSGPEFAGRPCGTDTDCTAVSASCYETFSDGCDGGANNNQPCDSDVDCPDGTCVARGECASFPGGIFTGQGCVSDLDCSAGEKCSGRCSAGSSTPDAACQNAGDCTIGECEGAQASDTLGGAGINLINDVTTGTAVFFTPTCPACTLDNPATPVLCDPTDPTLRCYSGDDAGNACTSDADCQGGTCEPRCKNRCLPAEELEDLGIICQATDCCENFDLVAPPCETTEDCAVNQCQESAVPLGSDVLPEGEYIITDLLISDLRMFAPNATQEIISCSNSGSAGPQFDPPLTLIVGPGRSNQIRSIIDITALEGLLGLPLPPATAPNCNAAFSDFPAWFTITSE